MNLFCTSMDALYSSKKEFIKGKVHRKKEKTDKCQFKVGRCKLKVEKKEKC